MSEKLELFRLALSEKLFTLSGERFEIRLIPESDEDSYAYKIYSQDEFCCGTQWYDISFELTLDYMDKEVNKIWYVIQSDREAKTDAYQLAIAAHNRLDLLLKKLDIDLRIDREAGV